MTLIASATTVPDARRPGDLSDAATIETLDDHIPAWRDCGLLDRMNRLSAAELLSLCRDDLPTDYLRFLSEVGAGPVADERLMIFGCPIDFDEIYGDDDGGRFAVFATDNSQSCFAFDRHDGMAICRIGPAAGAPCRHSRGFADFLVKTLEAARTQP